MSDVFYLRAIDPPVSPTDVDAIAEDGRRRAMSDFLEFDSYPAKAPGDPR